MTSPTYGAGSSQPGTQDTTETAKQQAYGVADQAKSEAASVKSDAQAEGQRVVEHAKGEARDVAEHAKSELRSFLGQAQGEAGLQAGAQQERLATFLRSLSDELGGILDPSNTTYQKGLVSGLAGQAGDRLSAATDWLETREPREVLDDVARFARRRPGAFLALAAGAGLLAGRLSRSLADDARDDAPQGLARPAQPSGYGVPADAYDRAYSRPATYDAGYAAPAEAGVGDPRAAYGNGAPAAVGEVPAGTTYPVEAAYGDDRRFPPTPQADTTYLPESGTTEGRL